LDALLAGIATEDAAVGDDPGADFSRSDALVEQYGVTVGQVWQLGEHRLAVGDCGDESLVSHLMDGDTAGACVTDPPYGIGREGILNDRPDGLRELFARCLAAMPIENGVVIAFQSPRLFPEWLDEIRSAGHQFERALWFYDETDVTFPWRGWLMTSQVALVSSIGKPEWNDAGPYHHDCYIVKTAGKQDDSGGHPTAKPLDVMEDLVAHTNGLVYEPFAGSGTTIIACERLGRTCYAVELSPAYAAVSIKRWADMTGLTPRRVD
jgi:DNA modification methylase